MVQGVFTGSGSLQEGNRGEFLIPVIIEDFKGSIAVKISNNKMDEKEIQERKKFMEMVKMGDTSQYVRNLKNGAAMAMAGRENWTEEENKKIMNIINDGHDWILNRIDLYIRSEVFRQLQKLSEERSKLETTIYNFTNEEMPEEIRELFKNGVDVVPRVKLSIFEVKKHVNKALKEYLERVHWKTNKSRKFEANDVIEWLKKAIALCLPNKFGIFTRLCSWISWPAKGAIHDNQSPPHYPRITSLGFNKPKTSATLVIDS